MGMLKRKCNMSTMLLLGIMMLLTISSMLIGMNQNGRKSIQKLSRGFYTENAERVIVSKLQDAHKISSIMEKSLTMDDYFVFKTALESGKDIRGVGYRGSVDAPMLKEGRFFANDMGCCLLEEIVPLTQ